MIRILILAIGLLLLLDGCRPQPTYYPPYKPPQNNDGDGTAPTYPDNDEDYYPFYYYTY